MRSKHQIQPGTTILKEKPFVYALSSKVRTERCDCCFEKTKLLKCSGCQYVYYCGTVCQREAWPIHKNECRNLKKISPRIIPDAARFLARLIKRLQKGGDLVRSYYTEGGFRMFKDLMSHYVDLKHDKVRMEHLASLHGVLTDFLGPDLFPNSAELMATYGRMCINSFNICSEEQECLGTGIYLAASVIDHSCDPTAVPLFKGNTLHIRTVKPLNGLDFSQVLISYIDVLNTPKKRQEELKQLYYFTCQCSMCLDPKPLEIMMAASCQNSECDGYINMHEYENKTPDELKCNTCYKEMSESFLALYKEVTEFSDIHLQNMKEMAYLDVCQICLKKQRRVLYKFNIQYVKTLDLAFESSIDFGQWSDAKAYGLELIEGYRIYYSDIHPLFGMLYLKLGKILLYLEDNHLAMENFKHAYKILTITHGNNSILFKELINLMQQANQSIQSS